MEHWEHLAIHAVGEPGSDWHVWTIGAPNYVRSEASQTDQRSADQGLRLLDDKGREGWQLVATECLPETTPAHRVYWLKRPVR